MREFLARALPWPQDGEAPSYVDVHHVVKLVDKTTNKPIMRANGKQAVAVPGRACRSVEEAVRHIEWCNQQHTDVYVCMSAQRTAEEKTSRRGFKYYAAIRGQNNIARHKALYVDVDVKPGDLQHGYATAEEAAAEFVRIRTQLGLPPQTFAIASGSGGFHAHWALPVPIDHDRWARLANAFCAAFIHLGFRGDTQCIVDGVRLLRVPGTWNYKDPARPSPVAQLGNTGADCSAELLEHLLKPYFGMHHTPTALTPKPKAATIGPLGPVPAALAGRVLPGLSDGLAAGMDVLKPTIEEIAHGCPWIAHTLQTGGADCANPLWLQSCNLSLFVQDGREVFHELSDGHPAYTEAETDALYDRQEDTQRARDLGWPRCQTIASYGAVQCQSCPRLALQHSPLSRDPAFAPASQAHAHGAVQQGPVALSNAAGATLAVSYPAPTLADLPIGYAYNPDNLVSLVMTDDQGVQTLEPVTSFLMEKPWLQQDPPVLNFTTQTHKGHERQIRLPYEAISDKSAFGKTMARQGMLVGDGEKKGLGDFFVSWIEKMRGDAKNVVNSQPFGWATKGGKIEGFVYAGHMWSAAVPRPSANPDPVLTSQYSPAGALDPWKQAAKLITNQNRPALDAILASAFAAPLVRFTGQTGLFLSTYSTHSGIGKSTALKVAQSVWGHPQRAIQSLDDTQNAVLRKIGDTKNLPLFWDELKTERDTERFVNLAFQLSLGKEKSRLAADTSYREPGTWQTLLCSTSNSSILAYVIAQTKTTAAGIYRVFEFDVPKGVTGQISPADAALLIGALNDNYGQAGLLYAQFLGQQHERIAMEVAAISRHIEKQHKVQADERFWLALMATLIAGAGYANECGLTSIDVAALARFLIARFQGMRVQRVESDVDIHEDINVIGILSRFLNEHANGFTLVTNIVHRPNTKLPVPATGTVGPSVAIKTDPTRIRAVRVHVGVDDHWVRIIRAPFVDWLQEQGYTPPLILKQLNDKFHIGQIRGRLGGGTNYVTAMEPILEFNAGDPVFQGMLEL